MSADYVVSDFSNSGFDWLCCGFDQTLGDEHVTLQSNDGWGIGDIITDGLDLTELANSRFHINVRTNPGNGAEQLTMALLDSQDNEAKWWFDVAAQVQPGDWTTLRARTSLSEPTSGTGDWQNLDLSDIQRVRLLGHWQHPLPFNMSVDEIRFSDSPYAGAQPDAAWRGEAADRIEQHRKSDLRINVTDSQGQPIPNASVHVKMLEHEFGFGSAVQAFRLRDDLPQHAEYKSKVEELFNLATIENNLKWPAWEGEWGGNFTQDGALKAIDWLRDQGLAVRGHNLVWPSGRNLSQPAEDLLGAVPLTVSEQAQLRSLIEERITSIVGATEGKLAAWDVVNESRSEHEVMDALSERNLAMVDWFNQTKQLDENATLYINDYGILNSSDLTNTPNQATYFETIEALKENGAAIEGIGFQGHFTDETLTGPENLWRIFDRFSELGLDMQVTEFDFRTDDEELQAQYTSDFLTAAFAHEAIDDFIVWGFWEDAHWRPEAAMYRSDWSIKPNGETFRDLVFDKWWTNELVATDVAGSAELRGFKGSYQIEVEFDGVVQVVSIELSDGPVQIDINLAVSRTVGDFNNDSQVTVVDVELLQNAIKNSNSATLFDLNQDGLVTETDVEWWIDQAAVTFFGDANLDGQFDSGDLIQVFAVNQYEDASQGNSTWSTGDWNTDFEFNSSDLVLAFSQGGYEQGIRAAVSIPEPVVPMPILLAIGILISLRCRVSAREF